MFKKYEFFTSQLFTIIATVFGVYLASSEGLKSAIEFQLVESDRTSYYQQTALAHELRTNSEELEEYIELWKRPNTVVVEGYLPTFDKFVWEASIQSDGTFEIPPVLLLGLVEFYREVEGAIQGRLGRDISREEMMEVLIAQHDKITGTILPGFERSRAVLREKLDEYDVVVE